MVDSVPISRALISVSDKTGVVELAVKLQQLEIEILSTGGTSQLLRAHGIAIVDVSAYTDFPELMSGRLKTLHPKIHGGILARRGQDKVSMAMHGICTIDLVVVNLYPFQQAIVKSECDLATAIEHIDIGGPAMIRSAAKNYAAVTVVVNNSDYTAVLADIEQHGGLSQARRFELACQAFAHTAQYDGAIANYLGRQGSKFPHFYNTQLVKAKDMRYGENPHQQAAFYVEHEAKQASIATARQLQGKAMSFNNIVDADAALECVKTFHEPACVIVKHANPCGVAIADNITEAYTKAYQTDPDSSFGGIIAFNFKLDARTAQCIIDQQFVEVIIAPEITPDAAQVLIHKANLRVLSCGDLLTHALTELDHKKVTGGLLIQERDSVQTNAAGLKLVSQRLPTKAEALDLQFAWKVVKYVKSNAIVYCRNGKTMGIGAGQMSRIDSAKIAATKAADLHLNLAGSVMASDAFLPFRDSIDAIAAMGVTAIIQPGGSKRDAEIIAAADEHGMAMIFTNMRHFRH